MLVKFLTTADAADKLGVSQRRVLALIKDGRLPAQRLGRDHLIEEASLNLVKDRKPGRPPLKKNGRGAAVARKKTRG